MRGLVLALCAATAAAGTETLFDLFGISQVELPGLDDTSLKKLYKRRALELHPDKSDHPDAAGRFRRLQEAYEGLKDPNNRNYFVNYARYGAVWRDVKTYADERLHQHRRGWVRTRRGVQMATERVDIRDEFIRGDGSILPLHTSYFDKAFEYDGVTVLLVADHDQPHITQKTANAFRAFASRVNSNDMRVASLNAAALGNGDRAVSLWDAFNARRGTTLCIVVPPHSKPAAGVQVTCDPSGSLPLRLARVAKWLREDTLEAVPFKDGGYCLSDAVTKTCKRVEGPRAALMVQQASPSLLKAARTARLKFAPFADVVVVPCGDDCVNTPRLRVDVGATSVDLPLSDATRLDDEQEASTFASLLDGLLRGLLPKDRAPASLVVSGLGDLEGSCKLPGLDGVFALDGWRAGRPSWRRRNVYLRWHPAASRSRGVGAWLLTDMEAEDRAWGFLEVDTMTPLDVASACWTFYCRGRQVEWECSPHVSVTAGDATPAPGPYVK
jgi:hypothetical protein